MVIQSALLMAVRAQLLALAVTPMVPLPPPAGTVAEVGDSVKLQAWASALLSSPASARKTMSAPLVVRRPVAIAIRRVAPWPPIAIHRIVRLTLRIPKPGSPKRVSLSRRRMPFYGGSEL
jgi:hypothetical protein